MSRRREREREKARGQNYWSFAKSKFMIVVLREICVYFSSLKNLEENMKTIK